MPLPAAVATIAAQAFRLMELAPISSFADETEEAQAAAEQYPVARDLVLEASDWSFASAVAALPEVTPESLAEDPDLPHAFLVPADCVLIREVFDRCTRWRRDGIHIRADAPAPFRLRYTRRIDNEQQVPASARTAIAWQLAVLLAPRWLGTASKRQTLERGLSDALAAARRFDSRQASQARLDGRDDGGDWVTNALHGSAADFSHWGRAG